MTNRNLKKAATLTLTGVVAASNCSITNIKAESTDNLNAETTSNEAQAVYEVKSGYTFLSAVQDVVVEDNVVNISYVNGEKTRITFLEDNLYRFNMEPDGKESSFQEYATPSNADDTGRIVQQDDDSSEYSKPTPTIIRVGGLTTLSTSSIRLEIDDATSMMKLIDISGTTENVVWEEAAPIQYKENSTIQTMVENETENFYGGGTQNGRFAHKGESINIANENSWVSGGVSSPNPFYWSTAGYGIVRNTFKKGVYDFGNTEEGTVVTTHEEQRYDAYIFVGESTTDILNGYYTVTGSPVLYAENSFYLGHLNCYNRDEWTASTSSSGTLLEDGNYYKETNNSGNLLLGGVLETLNGTSTDDYVFSARAVIDGYVDNDMPLGWFLPNDGYGCGYGKSDVSIDENIANLAEFTDYAADYGVTTGLWTQSDLTPNLTEDIHLQRDFEKEVTSGGIRTLKTDVAWVGAGYSFGLSGINYAYDTIAETGDRPTIITLDGWAGTQRYAGTWTGDQTGGNWEYIRFHIPTYIGQSLSGNPNVSSDIDGIFGGSSLIQTRDIQWKVFTTQLLDMDGWGTSPKKPYAYGEDYTSINRMYLKLRSELMPYIYTTAYTSANLGSGDEKGKPQVRAMFIEYPEDPYTYGTGVQYQFMLGQNLLVAPVYQDTSADSEGNDIRNGIYLPDENQIWIDYFTGEQYQGGRSINNYDAPVWKLPLFVKNGAIIPMYTENNNSFAISDTNTKGLDKTKRVIEFYPDATQKETTYDLYEDDGTSVDASDEAEVTYGSVVSTHFTSKVENGNAILTAQKSSGSYDGYDSNRETTFIVNVSKEPSTITASIGSKTLTKADFTIVKTQEEFDAATGNVYFYNTAPDLNKYASEGSDFENQEIITTPKLYVKFASTDVNANAIQLVVNGFENTAEINKNQPNASLATPTNITIPEDTITPTNIVLNWSAVTGATGYELETDGVIQSNLSDTTYLHTDLEYNSSHTYRVRALNADGYSAWSKELTATTSLDPYRNVPTDMSITYNGDSEPAAYAGELTNMIDGDDTTEYSSKNSDEWTNKSFIIDMKKIYQIDQLDYLFRANGGNGATSQFAVEYSNDGITWTEMEPWNITFSECPISKSEQYRTATLSFDTPVETRYFKFTVNKSTGGFFQSYEIRPYKVEGTQGRVVGDTNNDGIVDDKDLVQIQNYVGLEAGSATWDQVIKSDWNGNNYYDVQDIAYTTTQLHGGIDITAKNPEGSARIVADKTTVKKGETVTLRVLGANMDNVYAFGIKLPYSNANFTYTSVTSTLTSYDMKLFSFDRSRVKQTEAYNRNVNAVFSNVGDQDSLSGTDTIAQIKLIAQQDMTIDETTFKDAEIVFVSNNLQAIDALQEAVDVEVPDTSNRKVDTSDITVEGQDETVLQTNMGVDKLIDGKSGSDAYRFEFKWGNNETDVPARLPYDLTFTFKEAKNLSSMVISVRHEGTTLNGGALKDFDLIGIKTDGTKETLGSYTITEAEQTISFKQQDYTGMILRAKTSQGAQIFKLNIDEVEFYENTQVNITGIQLDTNNASQVSIGRMINFTATVLPSDASDSYYDVISSDESKLRVIKTLTSGGYKYTLLGVSAGDVEVSVRSHGTDANGKNVETKTTIHVVSDVYTTELETILKEAKEKVSYTKLYTDSTYSVLTSAVSAAEEVLLDKTSQSSIDNEVINVHKALLQLEYKGSLDTQPDSTSLISNEQMKVLHATSSATESPATNILDNDKKTYWHSSYATGATLPQSITIDLGDVYNINQLNYLPRQDGSRNGDVTRYQIEVSDDGVNFTPVVQGTLSNDGYSLLNKSDYKLIKFETTQARYVKFIALEALGGSANAYASAAEIQVYGRKAGETVPAESITVDKNHIDLKTNATAQINATITPYDTTDVITWTSSDPTIASVDVQGKITGIKAGQTTITVKANDNVSTTITVNVVNADKEDLSVLISEAKAITYTNTSLQTALQAAITSAETALNGDGTAIAEAYVTLAANMSELDLINEDMTAIISYSNLDMNGFEKDDAATSFTNLLANITTLFADPISNATVITKLHDDLNSAYASLITLRLDQLEEAIITAESTDLNKYVDNEAKANFKRLVETTKALKPGTNNEIKLAINNLLDAIKLLEYKASSEQIQSIQQAYDMLSKLDLTNYSSADQTAIKEGLTGAKDALENSNLSTTEATELLGKLTSLLQITPNTDTGTNDEPVTSQDNSSDSSDAGSNTTTSGSNTSTSTSTSTNSGTIATGDITQTGTLLGLLGLSGVSIWISKRKKKGNRK